MFDMSWGEVMLIGGVALVVIGPKDLPKALRTVGQVTARLKRMAGEFQSQFSEAMREAELDEVRREVEGINRSVASATTTGFNPVQTIRNEIKGAVDGVPKPATQAMPGAETVSDPSPPPRITAPPRCRSRRRARRSAGRAAGLRPARARRREAHGLGAGRRDRAAQGRRGPRGGPS